ncbi:MAG: class IV adenylate cyclase [Candidatus Bathyarchaeota archaeon]
MSLTDGRGRSKNMIEVEAKVQVKDLEKVKSRLINLGARKVFSQTEWDTYFNHPAKDFGVSDEALRIRSSSNGERSITYKGPKISPKLKTREELSFNIDDLKAAGDIIERLGFKKVAMVVKRREAWELSSSRVYLDEVENLGYFVEIEILVPKMVDNAEQQAFGLLEKLCLNQEPLIRESYLELVLRRL